MQIPVKQDITVIEGDDPKKLKIGWAIYENSGPYYLPSDDDSCYETDEADKYLDHCGKDVEKSNKIIWTVIPVLEFLYGQPWNNLALNYVMGLRPSAIRVTEGNITCDCHNWRVTVYLKNDKRTIKRIDQECELGCIGAECGQDLKLKLEQQKTGEKIPKFDASCAIMNEYATSRVELKGDEK